MNLLILKPNNNVTLEQFVDFWSRFYITNQKESESELEKLYSEHIDKGELKEEDIMCLFEWKNTMPLSEAKKRLIREKICIKLEIVNNLRRKKSEDSGMLNREFSSLNGPIWRIFLLHIINTEIFPIFDQNVYRAYWFLKEGKIQEIADTNVEEFYRGAYIGFFNNELLGVDKGISRKKLDEALWAFGKFLKTPCGKMIC